MPCGFGLRGAPEILGLPWSSIKPEINRLFELEMANEIIVTFANGRKDIFRRDYPGNLVELYVDMNGIISSRLITLRVDSEGVPLVTPKRIRNDYSGGGFKQGEMVDLGPINPNQPKGEIIDLPLPGESIPQFPDMEDTEDLPKGEIVGLPPLPLPKGEVVNLPPLTNYEKQASNKAAENIRISSDPSKTIQQPQAGTEKAPWLTKRDVKNFIDVVFVGYSEYQKRAIADKMNQTQSQGKSLYIPKTYARNLKAQKQMDIWPWIIGGLAIFAVGGTYYALKGK